MNDKETLSEIRAAAGRKGGLASVKVGAQSKAAYSSWSEKGRRKRAENLLRDAAAAEAAALKP